MNIASMKATICCALAFVIDVERNFLMEEPDNIRGSGNYKLTPDLNQIQKFKPEFETNAVAISLSQIRRAIPAFRCAGKPLRPVPCGRQTRRFPLRRW